MTIGRTKTKTNGYLLPDKKKAVGAIQDFPLFNRQVFHYATLFHYSGIQCRWIHVGLSLKCYDQSVKTIYINTMLLALFDMYFFQPFGFSGLCQTAGPATGRGATSLRAGVTHHRR